LKNIFKLFLNLHTIEYHKTYPKIKRTPVWFTVVGNT